MYDCHPNCVNRPLLRSKLISDGHTSNILHSLILFPDLHPAFVGSSVIVLWFSMYRSVPQIRPPFCNLSLSTKHRGGLYAECDDFSRDYALLPVPVKHDLIVSGGWGPNARRRDAPDASGRLVSFSVEGWGSRELPQRSWRVHCWCGQFVFAVDTLTVDSQVA